MKKTTFWMTATLAAVSMVLSGCQIAPLSGSASAAPVASNTKPLQRPNVLVILADDMGYSDLGTFGSEIRTPHLDQLAREGFQLTNFYSGAYCSPSRAMLMTGQDSHVAGIGMMAEISNYYLRNRLKPLDQGFNPQTLPADFRGYVSEQIPMMPEKFKQHGYVTLHSGKWHLSSELRPVPNENGRARIGFRPGTLPLDRGFDRSFALINGAAAHFKSDPKHPTRYDNGVYNDNGRTLAQHQLPADFYSTQYFTDRLLQDLEASRPSGKPFFAYLALTAPHWPLQVPDAYLNQYRGAYDAGYEAVRQARLKRLQAMGIVGAQAHEPLLSQAQGGTGEKTWDELSADERKDQARRMEIYAGMVTAMDDQIGRVVDYLKAKGQYDNTIIVFLSDNGPDPGKDAKDAHAIDTVDNMGKVRSTIGYGERWAEVSATPFKLWKGYAGSDGAVRVPAVIKMPGQAPKRVDQLFHITDLLPTLVEAATQERVTQVAGLAHGANLAQGPASGRVTAGELGGHAYVMQDEWKLSRAYLPGATPMHYQDSDWKLFNLASDPAEASDVAAQHPERVKQLLTHWAQYLRDNQVSDTGTLLRIPRDMDSRKKP